VGGYVDFNYDFVGATKVSAILRIHDDHRFECVGWGRVEHTERKIRNIDCDVCAKEDVDDCEDDEKRYTLVLLGPIRFRGNAQLLNVRRSPKADLKVCVAEAAGIKVEGMKWLTIIQNAAHV